MAKKQKTPPDPPDVEEHHSTANEADILEFWTEEQQEAACPVPFPVPGARKTSPPDPSGGQSGETK
jgi:hypothetical protein